MIVDEAREKAEAKVRVREKANAVQRAALKAAAKIRSREEAKIGKRERDGIG